MTTKRRPTGKTIDVDHIISVGRDRETGGAVIRLKDADGRTNRSAAVKASTADAGAGDERVGGGARGRAIEAVAIVRETCQHRVPQGGAGDPEGTARGPC